MRTNERIEQMLAETQSWFGGRPTPPDMDLEPGETLYFVAPSVELLELTRTPRPLVGGNSGFSYAAAVEMAAPSAELVRRVWVDEAVSAKDAGRLAITDRRILFDGRERNREWRFDELEELTHDERVPETWLAVDSRKRISGVRYAAGAAVDLRFYLALALATARDERRALYASLVEQLGSGATQPTSGAAALRVVKRVYTGRPGASMPARALQGGLAALVTLGLLGVVLPDQPEKADLSATSSSASGESEAARRDREAGEAAADKAAAEKDAADKAEAERLATEKAATEKAAADAAAAEAARVAAARAAAVKLAAAKAAAAKEAAARAAAAKAAAAREAAAREAAAREAAAREAAPAPVSSGCMDEYPDFCIPVGPDLDCPDISHKNFSVPGSDPFRFDADNDGVGCES